MQIPFVLQKFKLGNRQLEIFVPEKNAVQQYYRNNKTNAYWAKVWPASVGLCEFLEINPQYIKDKNILELAAGLGLPGIYVSELAKQVHITDIEKMAVDAVQQSANYLQLKNLSAAVMDWNRACHTALPDVLLLSDINYEPAVFAELEKLLFCFLENKVTIILSTPERLIAKDFIKLFLPYCIHQQGFTISDEQNDTAVSVFVLKH